MPGMIEMNPKGRCPEGHLMKRTASGRECRMEGWAVAQSPILED